MEIRRLLDQGPSTWEPEPRRTNPAALASDQSGPLPAAIAGLPTQLPSGAGVRVSAESGYSRFTHGTEGRDVAAYADDHSNEQIKSDYWGETQAYGLSKVTASNHLRALTAFCAWQKHSIRDLATLKSTANMGAVDRCIRHFREECDWGVKIVIVAAVNALRAPLSIRTDNERVIREFIEHAGRHEGAPRESTIKTYRSPLRDFGYWLANHHSGAPGLESVVSSSDPQVYACVEAYRAAVGDSVAAGVHIPTAVRWLREILEPIRERQVHAFCEWMANYPDSPRPESLQSMPDEQVAAWQMSVAGGNQSELDYGAIRAAVQGFRARAQLIPST